MVFKSHILNELKKLDSLYKKAVSSGEADLQPFYSKLAIIECCGWIEQSMDNLGLRAKRKVRDSEIRKRYDEIIGKNYRFDYESFSRIMLVSYGVVAFEKIVGRVDRVKLDILLSALVTLKKMRDQHAHTYIHGCMTTIQAPSVTKNYFLSVLDGLREFEMQIKKIK
jgi:hypothetical protein